ncbi:MAG: UDP-N-acetylglucosamine--N-acetylmuramyl-(pentapeptide) pyrophosphoryl-undecaprenol N-acetylglucosamine transferase, partial [Candidatus Riflebacteria bacterium]|nr:UDP-N-acetylglucosamine--N-acetylmuramyl-(pentapeptide) pyrophosphoryl-undecaprenol N-acetylglucosamine transferase [Candidatus Riflebacteria bacterium]
MKIIFSGGGTGGHIYPALAIREILLKKYSFESGYVGVTGGMEEKIVTRIPDINFMGVRAQGMPRTISSKWFSFPFVNAMGVVDAFKHLKKFKPELVVATGGFVSFPILTAAKTLGIPYVIHEQNAAMGVTNRIFAKNAAKVLLTYESAAKTDDKKVFLTGNPVRKEFLEQSTTQSRFKKNNGEFMLLAVGGSRGALSINKACIDLAN